MYASNHNTQCWLGFAGYVRWIHTGQTLCLVVFTLQGGCEQVWRGSWTHRPYLPAQEGKHRALT